MEAEHQTTTPAENGTKRSVFVTVLAWLGIIFTGYMTLMGALQVVMVNVMTNDQGWSDMASSTDTEPFGQWFEYFGVITIVMFLVSLVGFVSSIGLLKRKNWARLTFIAVLMIGIVLNIGGSIFQQIMMKKMTSMSAYNSESTVVIVERTIAMTGIDMEVEGEPSRDFESIQAQADSITTLIGIFTLFIAVAVSGLFAWFIWKLTRPAIVSEFTSPT